MTSIIRRAPWLGPLAALVVVWVLFAILARDTFPTADTTALMLRQTAVVGVASVGMTVVIVSGGIDLSVGSAVALTAVVVAALLRDHHGPVFAALAGIAVATACGAVNGAFIGVFRMTPFIVTLGTMSLLRGLAKGIAHEQRIDCEPQGLDALLAPLPASRAWMLAPPGVWGTIAFAAVVAWWLRTTRAGRHVFAVGSNEATARLCGVHVPGTKLMVYALSGALTGWAGLLNFSQLTQGDPTGAQGLELDVIAAVVIGGASLSGGEGSVVGAMTGALLLTVIKTGCTHLGLPNWVQEIVTGVIIVMAVGLDRFRRAARR